jgi:hypothetical protein
MRTKTIRAVKPEIEAQDDQPKPSGYPDGVDTPVYAVNQQLTSVGLKLAHSARHCFETSASGRVRRRGGWGEAEG